MTTNEIPKWMHDLPKEVLNNVLIVDEPDIGLSIELVEDIVNKEPQEV